MNGRDNIPTLLIASCMTACGASAEPNTNVTVVVLNTTGPSGGAQPPQPEQPVAAVGLSVNITTYKPCQVYLISADEAAKSQMGWWGVWHQARQRNQLHATPYTFSNLTPGTYTVVAFDPASTRYDPNSGDPAQKSDGAVIERFTLGEASQHIHFAQSDFKDWNCLSCPWLFVWNGHTWVRLTEVLTDVVGRDAERTDRVRLPDWAVIEGRVRLRLAEEKDEITFVRGLELEAAGVRVRSATPPSNASEAPYTRMVKGDALELEFTLPQGADPHDVTFVATGYYDPDPSMIESLVRHR